MVDVSLAGDILVAFFDFTLRSLVLLGHIALALLGLSQLNFDISERILELRVLNLTET